MRHIFVGIDLGDKNSVARIATDRDSSQRFGFVNTRSGRERLFKEVKRRSQEAGGAKIVMAYEASSCGFVLRDHAQANQIDCHVLAPTKMEKSSNRESKRMTIAMPRMCWKDCEAISWRATGCRQSGCRRSLSRMIGNWYGRDWPPPTNKLRSKRRSRCC